MNQAEIAFALIQKLSLSGKEPTFVFNEFKLAVICGAKSIFRSDDQRLTKVVF